MSVLSLRATGWQDIVHSMRALRKKPIFAATVILTIVLAIGGNATMFTIVRAVLLKPLEYRDPDHLVYLSLDNARENKQEQAFTLLRYEQTRAANKCFTTVGAFLRTSENMVLAEAGKPEVLKGARVSANFLDVLGIRPVIGREFAADEDVTGAPNVVMISTELWRDHFGGDSQIIGRPIILDDMSYTIVGVLPQGFAFPFSGLDIWVTKPWETSGLPPQFWRFVTTLVPFARLKPGVSMQQAQSEMDVVNRQYMSANPKRLDAKPGIIVRVGPLKDRFVSNVRLMLWTLLGATGFVLLIACANLAGLLLARASSRSREFAIRTALGAKRGALIRQLLTESSVLAILGGTSALLLTKIIIGVLLRVDALPLPRTQEIRVDGMVVAFTAGISVAAGILFGLFPALEISRPNLVEVLRDVGTAASALSSAWRKRMIGVTPRELLVVAQVALSVVLLIGAALLIKSFARLREVDPGFRSANVLTMKIPLPATRYDTPEKRVAFFSDLERRVAALPGVMHTAIMGSIPTASALYTNVVVVGQPAPSEREQVNAQLQPITPDYFSTMGIPMRQGRRFTERDDVPGAPLVAIINEAFARQFWPSYPSGQDPIGQHMGEGADRIESAEIIGIARNIHETSLASTPGPEFYIPLTVHVPQIAYLAVRTAYDPIQMASVVRREVLAVDPDQAVSALKTMDDVLGTTLDQQRLTVWLLVIFAAIALLLAVIGLYGVLAYSVEQRIQELGVRRALGAEQRHILKLIVGRAVWLTCSGTIVGILGALALAHSMRALLFHVSTTDPATFTLIFLVFVAVALVSSSVPAWRAARIDPMVALREA